MSETLLELHGVGKRYAGIRALEDISVRIAAGSVHALVGENGAGKSTLGKIIGGVIAPSEGQVLVDGEPVSFSSPRQALDAGIAVIEQEPALVPQLTVLENVFLADERASLGVLRRAELRRRFRELVERVPFELDPDAEVASLSIADQQKAEILRAAARDARLIVMDEPTSSLGAEETEVLHGVVRKLSAEGCAVVYVSHFLKEIVELAGSFTILRNGRLVETIGASDVSVERLVNGMLGEAVALDMPPKEPPDPAAPVMLSLRGIGREGVVEDISIDVRAGEIVGLAGLVGSGRTEVAQMVFGAVKPDVGTVEVAGEELTPGSPRKAIAAGIGFVPEDRASEGLLLHLSQRLNVTLPHLRVLSRAGVPQQGAERRAVLELLEELRVQPLAPDREVSSLSGGNQQKVLFGKWLMGEPKVLLLDEPTRGVDVGAKWAIYQLISSLARRGIAILLISSEADEVIGLAHRVLVMRRGRIAAGFDGDQVQLEPIMRAALGVGTTNGEARDPA